jgi:hypothetical protein
VLTVPDFAGNRYFNTLGNFVLSDRAAVLFPDFSTGDLLHLAGRVEIVDDGVEARRFPGAERLWRVHVSSGWRGRGALPLRWGPPAYAPTTLATGQWAKAAIIDPARANLKEPPVHPGGRDEARGHAHAAGGGAGRAPAPGDRAPPGRHDL